jgi:hypothetical protein
MGVRDEIDAATADQSGPLVAIAKALASRLDDPDEKSPAAVAKELRATLLEIADDVAEEEQAVDPLAAAREARARRKAAAAGL